MRWRRLLLPTLLAPGAFALACSATNGASIGSEVRDAEALDVTMPVPPDRDSSTEEDAGVPDPEDSGTKDAPADGEVTSASVRINEIFVNQGAGGDPTEFIELRGAPDTLIDDLYVRSIDNAGATRGEWKIAPAGARIGATGTWTLGGGTASGRIDQTIPTFDDWGLDSTKGAVHLLRGASKQLVDAVSWNKSADGGTVMGEGKPVVLSTTAADSFGRKAPSFGDTNDNEADFCAMDQSAGADNGACK